MSTIGLAPLLGIDGPLPLAPRHNLFTVALDLDDPQVRADLGIGANARWQAGVNVLPRPTATPFGWDPCSEGATMRPKDSGSARDWVEFLPFVAYIPDFCSGIGIGSWERFKQLVDEGLLAIESFAAERQLAQGQPMGSNPSLNDANLGPLLAAAAVGPVEGLALLETAIGETARQGVIHVTPGIATSWASEDLISADGSVMRTTACGTPVVIGNGYIGTDPDTHPSPSGDQEYAFATGPVFVGRGPLEELPVDISDALDTSNNDVVYRAERELLVGWDGVLQAGVLIDRSATP